MNPAFYTGTIAHRRFLPKDHAFSYRFFMWFLDLDGLDDLPPMTPWFSASGPALVRFRREDYYGNPGISLAQAIRERMAELTGAPVTGKLFGLVHLRTLGLYFSPVNFYYGFDEAGELSHFLAEVSNIPWNERHQYAFHLVESGLQPKHRKAFHVSPFNHLDQRYSWQITIPGERLEVRLGVDDSRGQIFTAHLCLNRQPLDLRTVRRHLEKKPIMTGFVVAGIYWQALRLLARGVPYLGYAREAL